MQSSYLVFVHLIEGVGVVLPDSTPHSTVHMAVEEYGERGNTVQLHLAVSC